MERMAIYPAWPVVLEPSDLFGGCRVSVWALDKPRQGKASVHVPRRLLPPVRLPALRIRTMGGAGRCRVPQGKSILANAYKLMIE